MKILITGGNGTVGRVLRAQYEARGDVPVPWNRAAVELDDHWAMANYLDEVAPDRLVHLAIASKPTGRADEGKLVNVEWPSALAWLCKEREIAFQFTSTAMVFTNDAVGPFTLESTPDATEGYGGEKLQAEEQVRFQNAEAQIVRLGWQIGDAAIGNNMLSFFADRMREDGVVRASRRWLPACSFLDDTATTLIALADHAGPGLFQLDANSRWTFYDIARAVSGRHGDRFRVEPSDDFVYDQRMVDARVRVVPLEERLPQLARLTDAGVPDDAADDAANDSGAADTNADDTEAANAS
ncbi:MAG: sugar nucleotide-binding protein [Acidobacteriota bacterium]